MKKVMKKLSIFFSLAIALGLASCDNYVEPNPAPQSNPQEPTMSAEGLTVALGDDLADGVLDLQAKADAGEMIQTIKTVACENLPEGAKVVYSITLSADDNFTKTLTYRMNDDCLIAPEDWEDAHLMLFGKSPKAKDTYIRFAAYIQRGAEEFRVGDENLFFATTKVLVTPFPSDLKLEDNYYLLGTINGWSITTAIKFNHSEASVYDDPVFTLPVEITSDQAAGGWWWKIIPESTYKNGDWMADDYSQFGPAENGDESLNGFVMPKLDGQDPGAGCIKESGIYLFTFNAEDLIYSFDATYPYLYTPGDANGWSHANSNYLYTDDYADYRGYFKANPNGFKIATDMSWDDAHTYGQGASEGVLTNPGSNISAPAAGVFYGEVNIPALTYKLTQINSIGIIGDALDNGWNSDTKSVDVLYENEMVYTFEMVNFKASGEWKFRMNGDWTISLGAGEGDRQLDQSNVNLPTPGAGTYNITLDLSKVPYTYTVSQIYMQ